MQEAIAERGFVPAYDNGKKVLWWIIGILTTIIVGMFLSYFTLIRNIVTRDELAYQIAPLNEKIEKIINKEEIQQMDIQQIKTDIAVLKLEVESRPR